MITKYIVLFGIPKEEREREKMEGEAIERRWVENETPTSRRQANVNGGISADAVDDTPAISRRNFRR